MCIVCQTITLGAAALTGVLPVATSTPDASPASAPALVPATASAPAIAGTTCKTVGQVRTSAGTRFTCTSVNNRRVWRRTGNVAKGTNGTNATVASTTTTTIPRGYLKPTCGPGIADCPAESPANANINECKLVDATPGDVAQGFPRPPRAKPGKQVLEVLVVPVRYAGMSITEAELRSQFEAEFLRTRDFFKRNSYGRVTPNFTLEPESQWVKVDVTWQQFVNARNGDLKRVTQDIVTLIPRANPRDFDSIFIVAAGGDTYWGGMDQTATYTHASGQVHSVYFQTGAASGTNFQHNLGHTAYYLEDLYLHPYFRTRESEINPLKYEVMSSGTDFTVWNRWLNGFVLDSEVRCVAATTAQSNHRLVHANNPTGTKLAMVPTAPGRALFAEYIDDLVHVYELNSTIGHGAGPMQTIGLLKAGQRVIHNGVEISVSAVDATGVYVTVRQ